MSSNRYDEDIVSTSREILEKFIRELRRLTTYVKILPPSLSARSIRLLRVRKIKDDIDNLTISISPSILKGMNGDYDGDSLWATIIQDVRLIKTFAHTLSPRYNYISRTTGKYSSSTEFIKDYIIILSELYSLTQNK